MVTNNRQLPRKVQFQCVTVNDLRRLFDRYFVDSGDHFKHRPIDDSPNMRLQHAAGLNTSLHEESRIVLFNALAFKLRFHISVGRVSRGDGAIWAIYVPN